MVKVVDIAGWRERTFSSLLTVVLLAGAVSTLAISPLLLKQQLWPVGFADIVALSWTFAIWRVERLSYRSRVLQFLAAVYVLAITLLLFIGPASLSYLLGPPLIAAILLSLREAMLALALGAASLICLGANGHIELNVPGWEHDPFKASLVAALNYCTIGTMLAFTCETLLKGLSGSLADARTAAATLRASEARLLDLNDELELTSTAISRLNEMVAIVKAVDTQYATHAIIFVNDGFLRRSGYVHEELVGHSLRVLQGPETDPAMVARISEAMALNQSCNIELQIYARDGKAFWVEIEMMPFTRAGIDTSHWVLVGRDITERRVAADAIHRLAFYDVLTGLPNRRLLTERVATIIGQFTEAQGYSAVLYLDLDDFKKVNDARGHATGDALLCHAASRLSQAVGEGDMVARIGGDEFVVLLCALDPDPRTAERAALAAAQKVHHVLTAPLELVGQHYQIAASIGVALPRSFDTNPQDLLREADTAMYRAKAIGRNRVVLFEDAMLAEAQGKLNLESDLAHALNHGELAMHLQLQVNHHGLPTGAELLMRWYRPDGSAVRPDVFIPIAESSGMIIPLGNWALRQACAAWHVLDRAGYAMPLSINVSPMQFRQPDFVDQVRSIFAETATPPHQLIFEVTEGLLIDDIDQTIVRMNALVDLGVRFSVDDFGTGYSNLAYLKKMPLYELKIDKSLMRDTPHDANSAAIVQSILSMAAHLGLRVVAEGIETDVQAHYLAQQGQPYMQGFLYHRPMPLDELVEQLRCSN